MPGSTRYSLSVSLTVLALTIPTTTACGPAGARTNDSSARSIFVYDANGKLIDAAEIKTAVGAIGVFIKADNSVVLCKTHDLATPVSLTNCEPFVVRDGRLLTTDPQGAQVRRLSFQDKSGDKTIQVGEMANTPKGAVLSLCSGTFDKFCTLQLQLSGGLLDAKGVPQHTAKFLPPKMAAGAAQAAVGQATVGRVTILSDFMRERRIANPAQSLVEYLREAGDVPTLVDVSGIRCPGCIRTGRESLGLDFVQGPQGPHPVKRTDPKTGLPVDTIASGKNVRILVVECDVDFPGIEDQLANTLGVPFEHIASWPAFFMFDRAGAKPRVKFGYQSRESLQRFFTEGTDVAIAAPTFGRVRHGFKVMKDYIRR